MNVTQERTHFATAHLGQFSASCHGRSWLKARMKAAWNVHIYALGRTLGFDPWEWMFHD